MARRLQAVFDAAVVLIQGEGLDPVACAAHPCARLDLAADQHLHGDLVAVPDQWPFADGSLDVVVLRHATAVASEPAALLGEAARVLTPGGQLLLTGVHACSVWPAWMAWQARSASGKYHVHPPWQLRTWLDAAGLQVEHSARYASPVPGQSWAASGGPLGGGFLLQARKRGHNVTRVHFERVRPRGSVANASLIRRQRTG